MHRGRTLSLLLLYSNFLFAGQDLTIKEVLLSCFDGSAYEKSLRKESKKDYFLQLDSKEKEPKNMAFTRLGEFINTCNIVHNDEIFYLALCRACLHGSHDVVGFFIANNFVDQGDLTNDELQNLDNSRFTPFLYACQSNNEALIRYLILANKDVLNAVNYRGENWLTIIAKSENTELISSLIESFCGDNYFVWDVNFNHEDEMGITALYYLYGCGVRDKFLKLLQDNGVDLECQNEFGETPQECYNTLGRNKDIFNTRYCTAYHTEYVPDERSGGLYLKAVHQEEEDRDQNCRCVVQ